MCLQMAGENFGKWRKDRLTSFLKERDVKTSLRRKGELVELAQQARELQLQVVEADDNHDLDVKFRTLECGNIVRGVSSQRFISDLKSLPPLNLADIFAYVLGKCLWNSSRLRNHRNDDGYQLFRGGHIEGVKMCQVSRNT